MVVSNIYFIFVTMNILEQYTKFKKGELYGKSGVYVIINVNNKKVYVGETINLETRIIDHLRRLLSKRHVNDYLQNSVNLHGIGSFQFDILEFCDSIDTKKKEHYWATYLHALDKTKGYNIKPTDPNKINLRSKETSDKITATKRLRAAERGYWHSKESIDARKETRKGYTHSEETKKKIGSKSIGRKIPKSKEWKNYMSIIAKENNWGGAKRKIIQLTVSGEIIKVWNSIKEASEFLNVSAGSIGNVLSESNRQKTCKGYKWKYENL